MSNRLYSCLLFQLGVVATCFQAKRDPRIPVLGYIFITGSQEVVFPVHEPIQISRHRIASKAPRNQGAVLLLARSSTRIICEDHRRRSARNVTISLAFPVVILRTYLKLFPCFILAEVVFHMAASSNHVGRISPATVAKAYLLKQLNRFNLPNSDRVFHFGPGGI